MYFKFEQLTAEEAYAEIISCINSIQVGDQPHGLKNEYIESMRTRLEARGYSYRGFLRVPDNDEGLIKRVIGKNGYYFYLTTERNQLDFIWYDRFTHQFLFWGDKPNLIRGMSIMLSRLQDKVDAVC